MSSVETGVKLWIGTVVVNPVLFGILSMISMDIGMLLAAVFVLMCGFIAGIPFLPLSMIVIKLANMFPYSAVGKMSWVFGILSTCVVCFYMVVNYLIENSFSLADDSIQMLTGTTIAALLISLYINRKCFNDPKPEGPVNEQTINQ